MAKNKKKKKVQTLHREKPMYVKHSNTFLETCYASARRILRAIGEDESLFDVFTKRQKQNMFLVVVLPPRIAVMQGHTVPRQYIRHIQEELIKHLKTEYFNKEEGVTWMDMATVGQAMQLVFSVDSFMDGLQAPQLKVVERLRSIFNDRDVFVQTQVVIANRIRLILIMLSQPNFRIYGQNMSEHMRTIGKGHFQGVVYIVTHECQSLRFKYHNKERAAFRVAIGRFSGVPYMGATIAMSKIFPGIERDRHLDIYIQSHAIHRFKERIDTLYPIVRNEFFIISLIFVQRIVQGPNGMQLIACIMPSEGKEEIIGYFAFTIDGNNLLVLTLLPLLSYNVPEGRVLYDRLHLSTEDIKYLGMDKLSFFYDVDIEQIPVLKQILYDELHLDYIRTLFSCFHSKNNPFNEKKTLFVKNFFMKLEERLLDYDSTQNIDIAEIDVPE
jgi:hypothetical protein